MACPEVTIQTILGTECIGDSLPKIMGNFNTLGDAACDLITKVNELSSSVTSLSSTKANNLSVVDSPTIDLSYNSSTGTLSAVTTSFVATSSSPMVAKAWARFNGIGAILDSYNISTITTFEGGAAYQFLFSTPLGNANYVISACANVAGTAGPGDDQILGSNGHTTTSAFQLVCSDFNNSGEGAILEPIETGMVIVFGS